MTAEIIQFPEEQYYACCPKCEGVSFHIRLDKDMHLDGIECDNEDCGWEGGIVVEGD